MDETEFFLPSEIARLVYGHLRTMGCDDVSSKFLNSSPNLSECRELLQRNRAFNTEANGLSLKEILDQYLNMNKLILSTVNKIVGDGKKFCDPIEALNYILRQEGSSNDEPPSTAVNTSDDIRDDLSIHSSSSEELYSDFSLNLKTPVKRSTRQKIPRKKLDSINETDGSLSDKSDLETSKLDIQSKPPSEILPRQSTRLQNKRASKNDQLSNSDGVKELQKDPEDGTETPFIVGEPPYSEAKIQNDENSINLSSDSEQETKDTRVKSTPKLPNEFSFTIDLCDPIKNQSPVLENEKVSPKKKTLKVLRPQRPPNNRASPLKRPCKNEKIKCKRNRVSSIFHNDSKAKKLNLSTKSKKSDNPITVNDHSSKTQRSSDELVFTTDPQPGNPLKTRRKSVHSQNDEENVSLRQTKSNKSLNAIDDDRDVDISVIKEKLIDFTKLHEHLAANINKVITNSPQKTIASASTEDLDNVIQKVVIETESHPLFDEILNDLMRDLEKEGENYTEDPNSNLPLGDYCGEEISPPEDTNQVQSQPTEIEEPTADPGDDVESQTSEPPAIIIELQQEQLSNKNFVYNQHKDFQNSIPIADDIRSYVSCTADIASSPDRGDQIEVKTHDGMINLYSAQNGEIIKSCKVSQGNDKIYLNTNTVLYPVNDGVPVMLSKPSEIQICGRPTPLSQASKQKYVPIAPKPNTAPQSFDEIITRGPVNITTRKKRTRGGKRGTQT